VTSGADAFIINGVSRAAVCHENPGAGIVDKAYGGRSTREPTRPAQSLFPPRPLSICSTIAETPAGDASHSSLGQTPGQALAPRRGPQTAPDGVILAVLAARRAINSLAETFKPLRTESTLGNRRALARTMR